MPEPDLSKETINGHACPKSFVIRTRNMRVNENWHSRGEATSGGNFSFLSTYRLSLRTAAIRSAPVLS